MEEHSWQQDVEIDASGLDVEWLRQAKLFMFYAEQAAKARDTVGRLKEAKDVLMAKLAMEIRKSPAVYGLEKVTEGAIQAITLNDKAYAEATTNLADAEFELDILSSAVRALDQKKSALENLVRLQGQSYFAGPTTPRDLGKEYIKTIERGSAREAVKRTLTRK